MELIDHKQCTSCGACVLACPKQCIQMKCDIMGVWYPEINVEKCVNCRRCRKVCHVNKNNINNISDDVFVAWNSNKEMRRNSASGGIATALYLMALKNNWVSFGVQYIPKVGARYIEVKEKSDIELCKNSKYLYCDCTNVYRQVKNNIDSGRIVLFIGLPCQVAGLKAFLGKACDRLITVDILCHGTAPDVYINQHIEAIEKKKNRISKKMSFRNPLYGTEKYRFTLSDDYGEFYNVGVFENDVYQIGYHKSLILKENCYNCKYARKERIGDLTISDFSGLGKVTEWTKSKESVSLIVVSTDRGKKLLKKMIDEKLVIAERRPSDEAFLYDHMFQRPSERHIKREMFEKMYSSSQSFEKSAYICLKGDIKKNFLLEKLRLKYIKRLYNKVKRLKEGVF